MSKRYGIIYADPPWRFKSYSMKQEAEAGEAWGRAKEGSHYDVMNTQAICDLPVADIADTNSVLFLWATFPKLPDALQVMEAWGFQYKTVGYTWVKQNPSGNGLHFGMGYWTRQNAEIVLLGTRGKPKRVSAGVSSVVLTPRGRHSAKPVEVRDRILQLMGDIPRIELFARETAPGWDCIGNEIDGISIQEKLKEMRDG